VRLTSLFDKKTQKPSWVTQKGGSLKKRAKKRIKNPLASSNKGPGALAESPLPGRKVGGGGALRENPALTMRGKEVVQGGGGKKHEGLKGGGQETVKIDSPSLTPSSDRNSRSNEERNATWGEKSPKKKTTTVGGKE